MTTTTKTTPSPARVLATGPHRRSLGADIGAVWLRETLTILRDPFSLIFSLLQPLIFLGLFAPLLNGLGGPGVPGQSTLQWFLPGVVVMITMFGTSMTGSNLQFEIMTGAFERILATPLSRAALLIGRALKELTPLVVQAVVIILIAWPFGFEVHPLHILLGLAMLGVFGVGIGALSYALAIAARKAEWIFWAVQQTLLFPLLILSGMMLPLEAGPGWMQIASKVNPLTYLVDAERALFAGQFGTDVWLGAIAAAATCALGLAVGIKAIRSSVF